MTSSHHLQDQLAKLEAERAKLVEHGYLQHCWLVQVKPGGTARTDRQYWQVRSRQPIFDGKRLKHLKTDPEITEYKEAIERGRQLKQIDRQIRKLQQQLQSSTAASEATRPAVNVDHPSLLSVEKVQPAIEPEYDLSEQEKLVQSVIATSQQLRSSLRRTLVRSHAIGAKNLELRKGYAPPTDRKRTEAID